MLRCLFIIIVTISGLLLPGGAFGVRRVPADNSPRLDREIASRGFLDIQQLEPSIHVELKYACAGNVLGRNVYGGLTKAWLRPEAALKLATASCLLQGLRPDLRLLVVDGLRPRHVQQMLWSLVQGTSMQPYIADPDKGSMHNYGCAVDITLADVDGERLDMGGDIDHFGALSQPRLERRFLRQGLLTPRQVEHRRLLRDIMVNAGFIPLPIEWWHFDALPKDVARRMYSVVE